MTSHRGQLSVRLDSLSTIITIILAKGCLLSFSTHITNDLVLYDYRAGSRSRLPLSGPLADFYLSHLPMSVVSAYRRYCESSQVEVLRKPQPPSILFIRSVQATSQLYHCTHGRTSKSPHWASTVLSRHCRRSCPRKSNRSQLLGRSEPVDRHRD